VCDTLVRLGDDGILFAKNSDRDANEAQLVERVDAADHPPGSTLRCTWIEIPQVAHTHSVLISRPWWMWGAEIGANEHGVVIGNEAVFTRSPAEPDPGLLGMDLLRLALERADSAERAVEVIVELLRRYGQGGSCSHERPSFRYDNSFLVADVDGAIVLETAGRAWATERVVGPGRSISNGLTIDGFAAAHADPVRTRFTSCERRRSATMSGLASADGPSDLMAVLRSHGTSATPAHSAVNGAMSGPCMHSGGGLFANSQTTGSWVADLRGAPHRHWVTATAAPCTSIFKPVTFADALDPQPAVTNRWDGRSLWWRHERLHRVTQRDPGALLARYAHERDRIEADWVASPPSADEAFRAADEYERRWWIDVLAAAVADRRGPLVRRHWASLDLAAGMPPVVDLTEAA
jgi:dipeptidase